MRTLRAALVVAFCAIPLTALAHPLGNFTINHHIAVTMSESDMSIGYVLDLAEIPAFQEINRLDEDGDGVASTEELDNYSAIRCVELGEGLEVDLDARPLPKASTEHLAVTLPGQNQVPTLRIECQYEAAIESGVVTIRNINYSERIGWAEIIVSSASVPIETDLPSESRSAYLTEFPQGDLDETPDVRWGEVRVGRGITVAGSAAPLLALDSAFDGEQTGFLAAVIAMGAALVLGAGHALAPGHGKTIVAAYLVGTRGTPRQAVGLAAATAVSHTAGVAILGVIAAGASVVFEPTALYPYLSALAGFVVLVVGLRLLWLATTSRGHGHTHAGAGHVHRHHSGLDHAHTQDDARQGDETSPRLGWKAVAALGFSGGLVPSASAVVLLLGALRLGRAWFGVVLVITFGIGMASALVGSGLLAVAAHRFGWRWWSARRPDSTMWRWVPHAAASAVVVLGLVLTLSALSQLDIL